VNPHDSDGLALSAPQPNPFQDETRFRLTLDATETVDVSLYDPSGRRVAAIFSGQLGSGSHDFAWRARSADGSALRSGMYFVQVRAGGTRIARRAVFLGGSR
jgi:flagellar hook assembly protein FlgD